MELDLLSLLSSRDNYKRFSPLISRVWEDRLNEDIRYIYKDIISYFNLNKDKDKIEWQEFKSWITLEHPSLSGDKLNRIFAMCDAVSQMGSDNSSAVFKKLCERYWAVQINKTTSDIISGEADMNTVQELVYEYNREVDTASTELQEIEMNSQSLLSQIKDLQNCRKYSWSIPELQLMLGDITKGDLLIVAARPDGGKTTFLSTQVVNWAKQLGDGCILYCNNEESGGRIVLRQMQAALNWTSEEVMKDVDVTFDAFTEKLGGDKIKMFDKANMSIYDIQAAVERCESRHDMKAEIIIIDNLYKVHGFDQKNISTIERYGRLAQAVRELAKQYGPIICASQLDASAEDKKFPDLSSLYGSKTAIQGECDVALLIGQISAEPNTRFLRAVKNKLPSATPEFRSQGCAVGMDRERAQLISHVGGPYV
jgi:replicative DNA helicase